MTSSALHHIRIVVRCCRFRIPKHTRFLKINICIFYVQGVPLGLTQNEHPRAKAILRTYVCVRAYASYFESILFCRKCKFVHAPMTDLRSLSSGINYA